MPNVNERPERTEADFERICDIIFEKEEGELSSSDIKFLFAGLTHQLLKLQERINLIAAAAAVIMTTTLPPENSQPKSSGSSN